MIKKVFALMCAAFAVWGDTAEELRQLADQIREQGRSVIALNIYDQALVKYQERGDYSGVIGVLCGRFISWQHLFNRGEDKLYAILARKEAEAMLDIAKEYSIQDRDHLLHFLLGKSCILLKDFPSAEAEFKKAIELFPGSAPEKGDWLAHLGEALFLNGHQEEGERMIVEGIAYIEAHLDKVDSFRAHVWISGAYLRLAKVLINDKKIEPAKNYLARAEEIILSDDRLVVRKEQLQILKERL